MRLSSGVDEESKSFIHKQKLEFSTTASALQEMLKESFSKQKKGKGHN